MADEPTTPDDVLGTMSEPDGVTKIEIDDVSALWKEYQEARDFDSGTRKQYQVDRGYASGNKQKNWASDANVIGTFIDIMTSFLYARNPDLSSRAARNVGGIQKANEDFAETVGIVVSRLWKKGRLKRAARKQVRSALSVGPGWLKVVMNHETAIDPVVQNELNDLDDNLERLRFIQAQLEEGDSSEEETNFQIAEKERLKVSLTDKLELVKAKGLAIDFVMADDMQVSLDVPSIADHLDADWNGNEIYIRANDLRRKFPRITEDAAKQATVYYQSRPKTRAAGSADSATDAVSEAVGTPSASDGSLYRKASSSGSSNEVGFVRVVEVWDKRDHHIKTMVEGVKMWARVPYTPSFATTRFYPYFNFIMFEIDGSRHPQSLAHRLEKLQDEYSSKRSNSRLNAERSVPNTLFDNQAITPDDAKKIEESTEQEFIGVKHVKGDDLRKAFAAKPVPTVDHAVYDTRPVVADMERISGVQEALSSTVTVEKTATEAKIQDQGFNTRSSADRDTLEDMLQDLSEYTTELALQAFSAAEVARIAGPKSFWPEGIAEEDILTLVEIDIKAGTTGKPNESELRQSWSVLLPLIQSMMGMIQQQQVMGNMPMVEALNNLMEETFRRLDERIDYEQFIPKTPPNLLGQPAVPNPLDVVAGEPSPGAADAGQTSADANTLV